MGTIKDPPAGKNGKSSRDRGANLVEVPSKRKPKDATSVDRPARKSLIIPPKLLSKKVSEVSLASGNFQRKLIAGVAVQLSGTALEHLYEAVQNGDLQAIKMTLETVGILQPKSAVSIVNNNTVDARSLTIAETEGKERRSFEHVARLLAADREKRQLPAGDRPIEAVFVPTVAERK